LLEKFRQAFCAEFGLKSEWLHKLKSKHLSSGVFKIENTPHVTPLVWFKGEKLNYVDGLYFCDEKQNINGGDCYSLVVKELVVAGLLDEPTAMKMLFKLSERFYNSLKGEAVMKSNETSLFGNDCHVDAKLSVDSERVTLAGATAVADSENEKYSVGYDATRTAKYDKDLEKATVGELAAAFGEAYHEATSRRRVSEEEAQIKATFGISRKELGVVSETYPVFYMALALKAVDAVIKENLVQEKLSRWEWGDEEPLGYQMFETGLRKEERMLADATRLCRFKSDDASPIWITTKIKSSMSGVFLGLTITCLNKDIERATQIKLNISKWIKENNYFNGQKIDGQGKFLDVANYTWDDVVLNSDVKDQVFDDIVGFLNHEELYRKNNLPFKRGIILYGKPGCGKTLLGKVIANEIDSTFIWLTSAQVKSPEMIRHIFGMARDLAPCVLFFEDIDMYTVDRSYGIFNPLVGEMLAQMDGMEENNGVIVVATTNRLDAIEGALASRPSRFDRRFSLDEMDAETTRKMVEKKLGSAKLIGVTSDEIATMVKGLNGSFIQEVVISAKRKAIARGHTNSEGIVVLDKNIVEEAVAEVAKSFKIMLDAVNSGYYKEYVEPKNGMEDKISMDFAKEKPVLVSSEDVEPVVLASVKPKNVNLTQFEKDEIDAEVNAAMLAIANANESSNKDGLKLYTENKGYETLAQTLFEKPLAEVDWKAQTKSNLRTMFRMLVLSRNVRRAQGSDAKDPFKTEKFISDMLHAMDMRSDRYYWVHAFVRMEQNFGRPVNLPFNPYKDQTSKDAALTLLKEMMGQIKSRKEQDDEINKKNGVFVPEKKEFENPELSFNEPKNENNVVQPPQHMK
jgi:SpoVK/Ycf46/Vps4 family AAA+-type ATPase